MADEYGHKLRSFTLRMEDELRAELEALGEKSGRNLGAEINFRLRQSLESDNKENTELSSLVASMADLHEKIDSLNKNNK